MTKSIATPIVVQAQPDHLESLSKAKPLTALTELIWNALDADSTVVTIDFQENELGGVEEIILTDNGHGLPFDEVESAFGNLGGSWKKYHNRSPVDKRILHGKEGKGRFRAFALGEKVTWTSVFRDGDSLVEYSITGNRNNLKRFEPTSPTVSDSETDGMTVRITGIPEPLLRLGISGDALERLTEVFALYLRDYPTVSIIFGGEEIDPGSVQKGFNEYLLENINVCGKPTSAVLQVVEWNSKRDRKICLCDEGGFTLHEIDAGIRPGAEYQFTAYLRCAEIRKLQEENRLELETLDPSINALVEAARAQMRGHFREKKARAAADLVKEWKEEGIYPYEGESQDSIETARRQVFDICALNVHEYLEDFKRAETKSRRFTFRLLREALEDSPSALQHILQELLDLPPDKQVELSELLDKTTLSAIIEANKLITDRLAFLKGLEELLFNKESKRELEERSQLHKILEEQTWIFGEEFHLTASDESLTTVLGKHIKKLRPDDIIDEVVRDDGRKGIIDLLLSREVPQNYKNRREFLVIELKRPSQKVDLKVKSQIESYALAVVEDERFDVQNTHWTFLSISNEMSPQAQTTVNQSHLPSGYFDVHDNYRIGLKTWGEVLSEARTRLELFRVKLGYTATTDEGVALLNEKYADYIPQVLLQNEDVACDESQHTESA